MTAAAFDLARSSSETIGLPVSDAQAVLRSMAGRVVIRPDGYTGLVAGAAEGVIDYSA